MYDCALPVTDRLSKEVLTLPMYATLADADVDLIARQVASYSPRGK